MKIESAIPTTIEFIKKMQMDFRKMPYETYTEAQAQNIVSEVYCKEIIEALEKNTPMKPTYEFNGDGSFKRIVCGRCEHIFGVSKEDKYCKYCGQAIDWSEEE